MEIERQKKLKKALLIDISDTKFLFIDLKAIIKKFIVDKWQNSLNSKYNKMLPNVQDTTFN